MLYRIKFICEEVDGFVRELKIDSDATFLDLNKAVLDSCGYADDQMTSFFLCDEEWERKEQVTREDMGASGYDDEDIYVMADTRLSELIEEEEQHLEYVFDPFNNRSFYLDVKEIIPGQHLKKAEVVRSKGDAPVQIEGMDDDPIAPLKGGKKKTAASYDDFDEDSLFSGVGGFNDDELDLDGFEISEGNPYE